MVGFKIPIGLYHSPASPHFVKQKTLLVHYLQISDIKISDVYFSRHFYLIRTNFGPKFRTLLKRTLNIFAPTKHELD